MSIGQRGFDLASARYDEVATSALGLALRQRVHRVVEPLLVAGQHVVDLGCGTGLDAAWMLERGVQVTALDASAEMVARAGARLAGRAHVLHLDLERSGLRPVAAPLHGALADFGVVNCVACPAGLARSLAGAIVPGGWWVVVVMGRCCPWELARGRTRRYVRRPVVAAGYDDLAVRYWSGRGFARLVAPWFELDHLEALGWALPPFEDRDVVEHRTRLRRALARLDRSGAGVAGRMSVGDHQLLVLRRRS